MVALGYFIWERQTLDRNSGAPSPPVTAQAESDVTTQSQAAAETTSRSIAVLPFVNMSSDQEQEWFADGLTEEILNSLAKTPDLLVTARTTSFGYKGSTEPIPEIATALGVDHILEGSVRRGGETLRITAQLIRAQDGFHLWSETFDRTIEDVISIQEEIAIQIARALETAMDPDALARMMSVGTTSVPAYDAYLKGVGLWRSAGSTSDVYVALDSLEEFEKAIELDPEFAQAYLRLYWFWSTELVSSQMLFGLTQFETEEKIRRRDEALVNAIKYQKDSVARNYYRAHQFWEDGNLLRAKRLVEQYLELRPNDPLAFATLLAIKRELGQHAEITALIRDVFDSDRFSVDTADQMLQGLRTVEDAEFMRTLAWESVERFGDEGGGSLLYQAHRQLLWASDIDGASQILPRVRNSEMLAETVVLADLRQLCAEERTSEAMNLFNQMRENFPDDLGLAWLGNKIIGDDVAAEQLFLPLDAAGDMEILLDYLNYPHFDPKPFPNLMLHLAGQGMEEREVFALPYRCNR